MEILNIDIGTENNADCILIKLGDIRILLDNAHPGDSDSFQFQLSKLLNQE